MDDSIKRSIEARKEAIYNAYNINDANMDNKINDLFNRINELGSTCKDVGEFEMKFASSPLNNEYISIFTDIAMKYLPKEFGGTPNEVQTTGEYILDDVESEARYLADDLTQPARRQAYQATYDKARDLPVIGEALYAKQNIDFFNSITGNNNREDEE